jgi:hypothetical protein
MHRSSVPITTEEVLSYLGEVILWLDKSRQISHIAGATDAVLGMSPDKIAGISWIDFLEHYATPEARSGLYWAVEAAFEEYVPSRFLPTHMPFRKGRVALLVVPDNHQVIMRIQPTSMDKLDNLLSRDLRLSMSSAVGFTNVILKGIDGPLTDIQIEDLTVVAQDSQFAQRLLEDLRAQYAAPRLTAPQPILVTHLLALDADDLPQRRLNSQQLSLSYHLPADVAVYSNGAIRAALSDVVRTLTQCVVKQSEIVIQGKNTGDLFEVYVTYLPIENSMRSNRAIEPVDLFYRKSIKRNDRLLTTISSLHARLTAYGCTARAFPADDPQYTTIMMNVPMWHGPLE